MSRLNVVCQRDDEGFPRVSGDEPEALARERWGCAFSPRERG